MKNFIFCVVLWGCWLQIQAKEDTTTAPISSNQDLSNQEPLLLISTLDGVLHAVNKKTGHEKWKLDEDPVFNVPMESTTTIKGPTFLPDPHDGSLYAYDPSSRGLTKLPFTIPELVQASPCRSSDGILYTGKKQDVWYAINPTTGSKEQVITTESAFDKCPGGNVGHMFIGRSEFKMTMFDTKSNLMRWNVTFADYSSHANEEVANDYDLHHLASSADGSIVTIDKKTGQIVWAQNYGYPVVAMYAYVPEGLQKVELTNVAKETMNYLLQQADEKRVYWDWKAMFQSSFRKEATLVPALYVGQYRHSLYALPALTHDGVKMNMHRSVQMLPGPSSEKGSDSSSTDLDIASPVMPVWRLIGYHKVPPYSKISIPRNNPQGERKPLQIEHIQSENHYKPAQVNLALKPPIPPDIDPLDNSNVVPPLFDTHSSNPDGNENTPRNDNPSTNNLFDIKWSEVIIATLTSLFTASVVLCISKASSQPRKYNGTMQVGRISFNPGDILGRGSEGTIVYRGNFDGRNVAVKRIVPECFSFADREVSLLRESDEHSHVVRYFCMEKDSQFQYMALELCSNTLQEYVENPQFRCGTGLDTKTVLHQAMLGLDHLHSLKIVHRDVKPSNILISVPGKLSQQRVVISDFGLCKKLVPGRLSFSHRSGHAGTDGWIAPEMILDKKYRMTQAVDIFSMGCVFYYVICAKHPFGDPISRQARIVNGDYSMEEIQSFENAEEAIDLIRLMLLVDPGRRPKSGTILRHPLFWNSVKILQFFEDVSDRIEKEPTDSLTMINLDRDALSDITSGIPRDWMQHLCQPLQDDLQKFRSYRPGSVRDLLRAMRNKKHHYRELPDVVKTSLGSVPDEFLAYFLSRFPRLLIHTYNSMACCRAEPTFKEYYGNTAQDHLFVESHSDQSIYSHAHEHSRIQWKKNGPRPSDHSPRLGRKGPTQADKDLDWRAGPARTQAEPGHFAHAYIPPNGNNGKYTSKGAFSSLNRLHQSLHTRQQGDDQDSRERQPSPAKPRSNSWQTVQRKANTPRKISESSGTSSDADGAARSGRSSSFNGSYADALVGRSLRTDLLKNKFDLISVHDDNDDDSAQEDDVNGSDAAQEDAVSPEDAKNSVGEIAVDARVNTCSSEIPDLDANSNENNNDVKEKSKDNNDCRIPDVPVVTVSPSTPPSEVPTEVCDGHLANNIEEVSPATECKTKPKAKRRRRFKKNKSKNSCAEAEAGDAVEELEVS